jgi:predicted DNA binding CopG/RHH family protein
MKANTYTKEELELVKYMDSDSGNIQSDQSEMDLIKSIVKDNTQKRKQINFRLLESDLAKLKSRALVDGIPYQTLLSSIVHKFLNGTLSYKN